MSSFIQLFWREQQKYLQTSSSKGIRYHPSLIRYFLSIATKSPAIYDLMQYGEKNNILLILPSRQRLRDYKNYITPQRAFSKPILTELINKTSLFSDIEKFVILSLDEMEIQENLVWNKHSGELIGFVDLGDADVNMPTVQNR